jgi:hypothetical protein
MVGLNPKGRCHQLEQIVAHQVVSVCSLAHDAVLRRAVPSSRCPVAPGLARQWVGPSCRARDWDDPAQACARRSRHRSDRRPPDRQLRFQRRAGVRVCLLSYRLLVSFGFFYAVGEASDGLAGGVLCSAARQHIHHRAGAGLALPDNSTLCHAALSHTRCALSDKRRRKRGPGASSQRRTVRPVCRPQSLPN